MSINIKTTQKIDRLSNYTLQLGLRNGVTLTSATDGSSLTTTGVILYNTSPTFSSSTSAATLTHKGYVDAQITAAKDYSDTILSNRISAGIRITPVYNSTSKNLTLNLGSAYNDGWTKEGTNTYTVGQRYGYFTGQEDSTKYEGFVPSTGADKGNVITAIKVDEYGAVIGVDYKKISTADLENSGNYDNYQSWKLNVGGTTSLEITGSGNSGAASNTLKLVGSGISIASTASVDSAPHTVTFTINTGDDYLSVVDGQLKHATHELGELPSSAVLTKIKYDTAGHITGVGTVVKEDLTSIIGAYNGSGLGLVNYNATAGTAESGTKFLTQAGTWASVAYNSISVDTATTTLPIVTVASENNITSLKRVAKATVTSDGNITATSFAGSGSALTNLNASNISSGTLSADRLPNIPVAKGGTGNSSYSTNGIIYYDGSKFDSIVVSTSSEGVNKNFVLTQSYDSNLDISTQFKDINDIIGNYVGSVDALVFKGTIGMSGSGASVTVATEDGIANLSELVNYNAGSTWVVTGDGFKIKDSSGSSAYDYTVESGDKIMALHDYNGSNITYPRFVVSQANLDGAVTVKNTSATIVENELILSAGGQTIKGAGNTVKYDSSTGTLNVNTTSANKLKTPVKIWGNDFDGTAALDDSNNIISGTIRPNVTNTYTIGTAEYQYSNIYATAANITTITGTLIGNADTATTASQLAHSLTINGKTFNGTKDISVSIEDIGGISSISITSDGSTGNVLSAITKTSGEAADIQFQYSLTKALTSISADLFNVTTTDAGAVTISPYTTVTSGKLYKDNSILGYGGTFYASNLETQITLSNTSTKSVKVLTETYLTDAEYANITNKDSHILIAKFNDTNKSYGFTTSGVKLTTSLNSSADTEVPTSKAVASYVNNEITTIEQSAVKSITLQFTSANASGTTISTPQLPANSILRRIVVTVDSAVTNGTITVGPSTGAVVTNDHVDLSEPGVYVVDLYQILTAASTINAVLSGTSTTCNVFVHVDYTTPVITK